MTTTLLPSLRRIAALVGALAALAHGAGIKPGGTLYIKVRNTRVMVSAGADAKVVAVLQPGAAVVWQGPDAKDRSWHKVSAGKVTGFVMSSNLSVDKPPKEITSTKGADASDLSVFMSSGAASKALGAGAVNYAREQKAEVAAAQLQRAEELAKSVGPQQVSEHAHKAGIRDAVGGSSSVAEAKP